MPRKESIMCAIPALIEASALIAKWMKRARYFFYSACWYILFTLVVDNIDDGCLYYFDRWGDLRASCKESWGDGDKLDMKRHRIIMVVTINYTWLSWCPIEPTNELIISVNIMPQPLTRDVSLWLRPLDYLEYIRLPIEGHDATPGW